MKASVTLRDGMAFDAHLNGHTFIIDAEERVGGRDLGPRPKGLTLVSLAGCTAMDVISILRKMRVEVTHFEVSARAVLAPEHPKKFEEIVVRYEVEGPNPDPAKVRRAVELSEERYCGVSATLKPAVKLSSEIVINGELLPPAEG